MAVKNKAQKLFFSNSKLNKLQIQTKAGPQGQAWIKRRGR